MRRRPWILLLAIAPGGCLGDGPRAETLTSAGVTAGDTTGTGGTTAAGDATTGSGGGATGDGSSGGADSGGSTTGGSGTGSTTGGNPNGKPDGEPCSLDDECMSGNCYLIPMGGFCAACNEDADCPAGGCQVDLDNQTATCTDGSLGTMCGTDAACGAGLVCAELFDAKGFVNASFCSTCKTDEDCPGAELCAPQYVDGELAGYRTCVAPGSVPNDQGCPVDGNGVGNDAACASGICNVADAFGLGILIGVCGECETSQDCGGGVCIDAVASLMGVQGAKCQ